MRCGGGRWRVSTRIEGAAVGAIIGIMIVSEAVFGVQEGNVIPPYVLSVFASDLTCLQAGEEPERWL